MCIYRSATPQTRSPGGSSTGAERDTGANTKDRTVSCNEIYVISFNGVENFAKNVAQNQSHIYRRILLMEYLVHKQNRFVGIGICCCILLLFISHMIFQTIVETISDRQSHP